MFEAEDFAELTEYLESNKPTKTNPVYPDYITTAMAHRGIFDQLKEAISELAASPTAAAKSPVFTRLCDLRFRKTGGFNPVIAGEMALETGRDFETVITPDGFKFQTTTGYFNRLPYDHLAKDGDYIDGISYPSRRRKKP